MKKIVLALIISVMVVRFSLSFAQEQKTYNNEEGHFSFEIPDGWIQIPDDILKQQMDAMSKITKRSHHFDASFQKMSEYYFTYPYFHVKIDKKGKYDAKVMEKQVKSKKAKKEMVSASKDFSKSISNLIAPIELGEFVYDPEKQIFFTKTATVAEDGTKIEGVSVILLSGYGSVRIYFSSTSDTFSENVQYLNQVIDSFVFDQEYQYKDKE